MKKQKHFCTFSFNTLKESIDNMLPVSIWEVWLNLDSSTRKFSQHLGNITNTAQYTIMLCRLQHLSWLLVGLVGLICFVLSPDFCGWKLAISFSIRSSNSYYSLPPLSPSWNPFNVVVRCLWPCVGGNTRHISFGWHCFPLWGCYFLSATPSCHGCCSSINTL